MILAIANHKGGTGKTTTALNMSAALSALGKEVILVDLDPQFNLTYSMGVTDVDQSSFDVFFGNCVAEEAMVRTCGMFLIPGSAKVAELERVDVNDLQSLAFAAERLRSLDEMADFVVIDCPPSNGFLTRLALSSCDQVIIPMLLDVLSVQGLNQILDHIMYVKENINDRVEIGGVLGVAVDGRRQLTSEILEFVRDFYDIVIFNNFIRANVRAAEAPSHGMSVLEYAPNSNSARDYMNCTKEFLRINDLELEAELSE